MRKILLLALAYFCLCQIYFSYPLMMGQPYLVGDIDTFFYPSLKFFAASIREGDFPQWNPLIFCGVPYVGEPRGQAFYPFSTWLFALVPRAEMLFIIISLHMTIAGLGTAFLARESLKCGWFAAGCGGLIYAFSGFVCHWAEFIPVLTSLAWIPWIFWACIRWLREPGSGRLILFSIFWCLMLLTGSWEVALEVGVFVFVPLAVYLALAGKDRDWRLPGGIILGFAIGSGLAMIQILPGLEMFMYSKRAMGYAADEASRESMPVWRFFAELVVPNLWSYEEIDGRQIPVYLPTPFAGYVGLCALLLAGYGFYKNHKVMAYRGWGIFALAGLFLSWGSNTPVYYIFYNLGFHIFRHVSDFIIFFTLGIGVLTAGGVQNLLKLEADEECSLPLKIPLNWAWAPLFLIAGGAMLFVLSGPQWLHPFRSPHGGDVTLARLLIQDFLITVFALVALGSSLVVSRKDLRRALLVIALFFPLFAFVRGSAIARVDLLSPADSRDRIKFTDHVRANLGPYRVFNDHCIPLRSHKTMDFGLPDVWGYVSGLYPLQRYHILQQQMQPDTHLARTSGRRLMDLFSARIHFFDEKVEDENLELFFRAGRFLAYENPHAQPRVSFAQDIVVMPNEPALNFIARGDWNPSRQVILPSQPAAHGQPNEKTMPPEGVPVVRIDRETADHVFCEVYTNAPGALVLRDAFYPGWEALVDGEPVRVEQADFMFRAVVLEKGFHKVEFVFNPASQTLGLTASAVSLLLVVLLAVRKRKQDDNR
jgi:hypothetical protein